MTNKTPKEIRITRTLSGAG